jgi:hypothetical protein
MRAILIAIFTFFSLSLAAQRECFTAETVKELSIAQSATIQPQRLEVIMQQGELSNISIKNDPATSAVIRIPVVVHILYNSTAQNVSDDQVRSQLAALNRDFRKRNSDTALIPERFKALAADVEIEFQMAVVSPNGTATTGIIRKQTTVKEWGMDDKIKYSAKGGDDGWNSKEYLNIWVGNINKTLGYSSAINGPAEKDGIVISNSVFGTIGKTGAFNKGRTLVHEVGHWLGLKHIWGDAPCGDDEVDDTPKQAGFTSGCPTEFRATCGASTLGDMYMNYMDFTNDACMNMFTYGQKNRMRAQFYDNGFRHSLLYSKGLDSANIKESPVVEAPKPIENNVDQGVKSPAVQAVLYPNPASRELVLKLNDADWSGKEARIININGAIVQKIRLTSQSQVIPVASLKQGLYFIFLEKGDKKIILKFLKTDNLKN